jgi:HlyD family secretion protein
MAGLLCALPFAASLFAACGSGQLVGTGYVEGEYVLIAPVETAEIERLEVNRGDRVAAGQPLAALEARAAEIAVAEAQAALAEAHSRFANLKEGKRPEEIAVVEASLASALAQEAEARRTFERQANLARTGIVTQAQLDDARTALDMAGARVGEVRANLEVMRLPARAHEIAAAAASEARAAAALEAARWRLGKRRLAAEQAGIVTDILRRPGEIAGPQAPVLTLLPDGAVRLRVFVGEARRSALSPGVMLAVTCSGCPAGLLARVTYVAADPEFTPPVLYSPANREKLVYLVEAAPESGGLAPGQIVDVALKGENR